MLFTAPIEEVRKDYRQVHRPREGGAGKDDGSGEGGRTRQDRGAARRR